MCIRDSLSTALIGGRADDIVVVGEVAYVAYHSNGLLIIDVSESTNVGTILGRIAAGTSYGVDVEGGIAYLAGNSQLIMVDVEDPANPTLIDAINTPVSVFNVDVMGDTIYVTSASDGVNVLENPLMDTSVSPLAVGVTTAATHHSTIFLLLIIATSALALSTIYLRKPTIHLTLESNR